MMFKRVPLLPVSINCRKVFMSLRQHNPCIRFRVEICSQPGCSLIGHSQPQPAVNKLGQSTYILCKQGRKVASSRLLTNGFTDSCSQEACLNTLHFSSQTFPHTTTPYTSTKTTARFHHERTRNLPRLAPRRYQTRKLHSWRQ